MKVALSMRSSTIGNQESDTGLAEDGEARNLLSQVEVPTWHETAHGAVLLALFRLRSCLPRTSDWSSSSLTTKAARVTIPSRGSGVEPGDTSDFHRGGRLWRRKQTEGKARA